MENSKKLTWFELASLEIGGAICLPVIMVGHAVANKYGLASAISAILIGNALLLALAMVSVHLAHESKKRTAENAVLYFGEKGGKLFALALLLSKTCWFGIQLGLIALSTQKILPDYGLAVITMGLGMLIISYALAGIKALSVISTISLPLMVLTMGFAAFQEGSSSAYLPVKEFTFSSVSLIVATAITAVIDMPTYFRHQASLRDGRIASLLFLGIGAPLIEGLGVFLFYKNPSHQIVDTLQGGSSFLWTIWVALFLLLAGWTTNNTNLYSAVNSLQVIFKDLGEKKGTLLVGAAGVLLSLCGVLDHFTSVLQIIGIVIGSMGIIVLSNFAWKKRIPKSTNRFLWATSVVVGLLSFTQIIELTSIPLIDAIATGTIGTFFIGRKHAVHT